MVLITNMQLTISLIYTILKSYSFRQFNIDVLNILIKSNNCKTVLWLFSHEISNLLTREQSDQRLYQDVCIYDKTLVWSAFEYMQQT